MDSRWVIRSLSVLLLVASTACQNTVTDCSLFEGSADDVLRPMDTVIAPGDSACVGCRYFTRAPMFQVELEDTGFTAIQPDSQGSDPPPEECDCFNPSNGTLCFQNVDISAQRRYRCTVQEPDSINLVACEFSITLATPPVITPGTNRMFTVNQGDTEELVLVFGGANPTARVQWLKDNAPVTGQRFTVNPQTGSLTISDIEPGDRGEYEVVVSNSAGEDRATYQLFVNFVTVSLSESPLPGGGIRVECMGLGYPLDLSLTLNDGDSGLSTTDLTYESEASISVDVTDLADCMEEYVCVGRAGGKSNTQRLQPDDCSSTPDILSAVSTNTSSVTVTWQSRGANSFTVRYRMVGSTDPYMTLNVPGSVMEVAVTGLSPGQRYSFQVGAGANPTEYSPSREETVLTCEANFDSPILGVSANTVSTDSQRTITLTWAASSEDDVTGYRVYVVPCMGAFPCTPSVTGRDVTEYEFPPEICDGVSYNFYVQSINECGGGGPNSSLVVRACDVRNRLTELKPDVNAVTIKWTFADMLSALSVSAMRVAPNSQNQLVTTTYTVPAASFQLESVCIRELEPDTTYNVCLEPQFSNNPSGNDMHCMYVTTLQEGQQQQDIQECLEPSSRTTPTSTVPVNPGSAVIQNWHIAVIVVGGLAIVAMVFCLVGLCFACQNSKQKVDFGSNSSLDTATYNQSIRDGVSMQRSMSPSRSCLSYHHKGHSTNWSDHVDTLRQMETDGGTHV